MISRQVGLSALALLLVSACSSTPYSHNTSSIPPSSAEIVAPGPPPELRSEAVPPPPAQTMVWQTGHWTWNGQAWDWVPGQYVARPQPTAQWFPGRWERVAGGGWRWMPGHWG